MALGALPKLCRARAAQVGGSLQRLLVVPGLGPREPAPEVSGLSSAVTSSGKSPLISLAWVLLCSSVLPHWAMIVCILSVGRGCTRTCAVWLP